MKRILAGLAVGLFLLGMVGAGNATVIDLNAYSNSDSNPVSLILTAGTYDVTPISGYYTAWNAWGYVNLPNQGWINNYSLSSAEFAAYTLSDGIKYGTAAEALANALSTSFTLASDGSVDFYIADSWYSDNTGGISLDVSPASETQVPEPSTILLLGLGIVGIARAVKKKYK